MAKVRSHPMSLFAKKRGYPWSGYFKHLINVSPYVYVKIRKHGFRYYLDAEYHRLVKQRARDRKKKMLYGSGYLSNTKDIKRRLIKRDGCICKRCHCKFPPDKLSIDHIIQRSRGGSNSDHNLQLLCIPCHREKDRYHGSIHPTHGFFPFRDAMLKLNERQEEGQRG